MAFTDAEITACKRLIELALEEDLGPLQGPFGERPGDLTSKSLIPPDLEGKAVFVSRAEGVLAGLPAAELVFQTPHTPLIKFEPLLEDGTRVHPGNRLARVSGLMQSILLAERTALNFLQHLSGIATLTRKYVDAVEGLPCKILDTRKTLPGWRLLEKYAVRCGGGHNHRMGLHDGILIKDNHLAALGERKDGLGGADVELMKKTALQHSVPKTIQEALQRESALHSFFWRDRSLPVEIEVDTFDQLARALLYDPDIVLLDNMSLDQLQEAVKFRNAVFPNMLLEASGGVTLATVRAIAETGVDRISVGELTHSAPALDIGLDYEG